MLRYVVTEANDISRVWHLRLGDGLVGSGRIQRSHRQQVAKKSLILDGKINQDLAEAASGRSDKGLSTTSKAEQFGPSRRTSKTKRIKQRHHKKRALHLNRQEQEALRRSSSGR